MPSGDTGTYWTLRMMGAIARRASHDSSVRRAAGRIVGGLPADPRGRIEAIRRYLSDHVKYVLDPDGIEYVQQPARLVAEIDVHKETHGDCDDVATLGAALGKAIGMRARFVIAGFKGPTAPFTHVYVELSPPDREEWAALDTTRPAHSRAVATRMDTREV